LLYGEEWSQPTRQQHLHLTILRTTHTTRHAKMHQCYCQQYHTLNLDQIEILHTVFKSALEPSTENQHKPLLHYAAFHNSPVSALLILRRGVKVD